MVINGQRLAYTRIPHMNDIIPFVSVGRAIHGAFAVFDIQSGTTKELWKASSGAAVFFLLIFLRKKIYFGGVPVIGYCFHMRKTAGSICMHLHINTKLLTSGDGEIENVTRIIRRKTIYYTTNIADIDRRHIWKLSAGDKTEQLTKGNEIEWSPVIIVTVLHPSFLGYKTRRGPPLSKMVQLTILQKMFPNDFPSTLFHPSL